MDIHRPRLTLPVAERDHVQGPPSAAVTLVEYADFQCPTCGAAFATLKEVHAAMGDRLRVVFRHFPMARMHPRTLAAAEAAEAAGDQGRFWEMHEWLFTHQLELDDLAAPAAALGLDAARFQSELAGHVHLPRVQEDFRGGIRSGVNGTPTFFINELRYNGTYDVKALLAALEQVASPSASDSP